MSNTVLCTAKDVDHANTIIHKLKTLGIGESHISVLMANRADERGLAIDNETKAPEGATIGAGSGAVVGGALGWLAGIGALAIPGLGPFIAAGPIMAALSGMAVGGSVGSISGALVGMGIPEYEAQRFQGHLKGGRVLISVHTGSSGQSSIVKQALQESQAEDIAETTMSDDNSDSVVSRDDRVSTITP